MNYIEKIPQPVLVTGANGFIGRRVVHKLLENGIMVTGLVLPDEDIPPSWGKAVKVIRGSIADPEAVQKAMGGMGTVIHLAAVVDSWGDEQHYWNRTVQGSRYIVEGAVKRTIRVVLASSIVVYGDKIYSQVCTEEVGYGKTLGPYSRTKQAQEKLAWEFYNDKGMKLTVVRPANVYGPGSGPWVHEVIDALNSGMPSLVGGGNVNAGLAYVDNVSDILILAGSIPEAIGRTYNACDDLDITWRQYFSDIAKIIGANPPKSIPWSIARAGASVSEFIWKLFRIKKHPPINREVLNLLGSDNRFSINRVQEELGYEPKISYSEGVNEIKKSLSV